MVIQHPGLTPEKWVSLGYSGQILNTAAELGRTLKAVAAGDSETARRSMERALELLDLTREAQRNTGYLPELSRSREVLAGFYADAVAAREEDFKMFLLEFLGLDRTAATLKDSYR